MAITSSGLGSGLDISSLVAQLVAAEGQPATLRLDTKEARLQADLSAIGTLKSALSEFQDTVKVLNDADTFLARRAETSDVALFTATADKTAVASSYDIEVVQLAESAKVRSGDFSAATDVVGTGTLDITLGASSFQVTIDTDNQTLEGVRDAINAASDNPGIAASIINVDDGLGGTVSRLVLSSEKTGSANTIDIAVTDDDLNNTDASGLSELATVNLTTLKTAQDAIINLDQQQVTRDSNSFSDVITGVTLNLKSADVGVTETLTIALNTTSVKIKVNSFVEAYNLLADTMKSLGAYNAETGTSGGLQGDSSLRSVQNQIRLTLTSGVSGLDFGTLAEIGITTDANGHLTVDDDKIDSVLNADFSAVSELFSSENGLANSLENLLDGYIGTTGTLGSRTESIQSRIDSIGDDRIRLNDRLLAIEARYTAQFTAMDILVGQLQGVSSFLTSQLANLPQANSINSN
jgi:flagellar hook-associated protein 2